MSVRFLRGDFFYWDGFAINDFEYLSLGLVTDLTLGVIRGNNCSWGPTNLWQR